MRAITFSILALTFIAACGNTDRPLRDLQSAGGGPDEFAVIPQEPLEIPSQLSLPQPTPGGANRADPRPNADAISALGGSASAQVVGGIPSGDNALVAQAVRYGVEPTIRAELAAADAAKLERARRSNIFNPLGRDRYFPTYAGETLDAFAELERLRALGIPVPTPVTAQPQRQQQVEPQQNDVEDAAVEPGPLQRALDPFIDGLLRGRSQEEAVRENCVFTTAGPGSQLRRVCTPVEPEAQ